MKKLKDSDRKVPYFCIYACICCVVLMAMPSCCCITEVWIVWGQSREVS